jgi:hypothetical protein
MVAVGGVLAVSIGLAPSLAPASESLPLPAAAPLAPRARELGAGSSPPHALAGSVAIKAKAISIDAGRSALDMTPRGASPPLDLLCSSVRSPRRRLNSFAGCRFSSRTIHALDTRRSRDRLPLLAARRQILQTKQPETTCVVSGCPVNL